MAPKDDDIFKTNHSNIEQRYNNIGLCHWRQFPTPRHFLGKRLCPIQRGSQYNATFKSASSLGFVQQFSMKLVMVATPEHSGKYNCAAKNRLLGITVRSLQVYVGVAGNTNLFKI